MSDDKRQELEQLRQRVEQLESELDAPSGEAPAPYWPTQFYTAYYATSGFMLGIFGALTSLLFNVVGASIFEEYPLQLIRVYLTFPLGDRALELESGLALAIGCVLYIGTGMLLGVPFYLILVRLAGDGSLGRRFLVATVLGLIVWVVNFYLLLAWLQPALIDMSTENLIINQVPWWVGASTHVVYGWTMALVYPLGQFTPYRAPQIEGK